MMTSSIFPLIERCLNLTYSNLLLPRHFLGEIHTQREEMDDGFVNIEVSTGSQALLAHPGSTPADRGHGQPSGCPRGSFTAHGDETTKWQWDK